MIFLFSMYEMGSSVHVTLSFVKQNGPESGVLHSSALIHKVVSGITVLVVIGNVENKHEFLEPLVGLVRY